MTFKFLNRRSDLGIDDRDIGQDMVLKVPWGSSEEDEYPVPMNEDERGLTAMEKDQANNRGYVICTQCIADGAVVQQMRPLMDWNKALSEKRTSTAKKEPAFPVRCLKKNQLSQRAVGKKN